MTDDSECILLLDNGALKAESIVQLRVLAKELGRVLGKRVFPVSLLHSSKIDPSLLGGEQAQTFVPFLREQRTLGVHSFTVIPLFFGPSGALVDYLPSRVSDLQAEGWSDLAVRVLPTLVYMEDNRVAKMMAGLVLRKREELGWKELSVAMCDHGTPSVEVNGVRELVAQQMREILEPKNISVTPCSMERREGAQYDFNEPLLESLLGSVGFQKRVIVSMLFAGPGRHAGGNGDVAQICDRAMTQSSGLEIEMTELVGSMGHELVEILADRYSSS